MRVKNECNKERKVNNPYEIWHNPQAGWVWRVLKKWQIDDNKPDARWFVAVKSPMTYGLYDLGDEYTANIKKYGIKMNDVEMMEHLRTEVW